MNVLVCIEYKQSAAEHQIHTLYAIHHIRTCPSLRQHPQQLATGGYLAGYGPWHEYPCPHLPLLRTQAARAPLHLHGAGHGHARSKESSVEPVLRRHRAWQVKCPRRNQRLMPLHQLSRPLLRASIMSVRFANGSMDIV